MSTPPASRAPAPLVTTEVDGLAVAAPPSRRARTPARPTVVLVHGAMDRAASFGRTMRRLGRHWTWSPTTGAATPARSAAAWPRRWPTTPTDLARVIGLDRARRRWWWSDTAWAARSRSALAAADAPGLVGLARVRVAVARCSTTPLRRGRRRALADRGRREGPPAGAEHFYRLMVGDHTWDRLRGRGPGRPSGRGAGADGRARATCATRRLRSTSARSGSRCWSGVGRPSPAACGRRRTELRGAGAPTRTLIEIAGAGHGAHLIPPRRVRPLLPRRCVRPAPARRASVDARSLTAWRRLRDLTRRDSPGVAAAAFVLSGGGNLGAIQVGMLQGADRAGASSPTWCWAAPSGALNGAGYALAPTADGRAPPRGALAHARPSRR